MAQDIVNKLQSLSYTSKDFNSIYPELLNTVKKLTYKWDPSISNESDPGVLLLKLNAIIADKCNYNIDTAVLECFPLSVTQQRNARQLFEQLGYYMHWYISATTDVTLRWNGVADTDANKKEYTIPAFTMVSDADSTIVYTLIGPSEGVARNSFIVADQKIYTNRENVSFKAIQGVAVDYNINGSTLITSNMLDSNNRLYFPTSDVAENGIFIRNYGLDNYNSWIKKENLLVESVSEGNKFYKFGISQDTSTCYLEFPDNAEEIIKDGIYITYIKTDGENGNIQYNALEKFYVNVTPKENTDLILSSDNVKICNYINGSGGQNFESINEAYKGYKSTVGTFNTLVTIRDYINACLNSGLVSNCFVCDRYNDIQSTYDIMSQVDGIDQHITHIDSTTEDYKEYFYQNLTGQTAPADWNVQQDKYYKLDSAQNLTPKESTDTYTAGGYYEKKESGRAAYSVTTPDLTAFSLKLYLLQYSDLNTVYNDNLYENFNATFDMLSNDQSYVVKSYIEDMKMISHDYVDIKAKTTERAHFCYFKNKYPLSIKITPQYELTEEAKKEVKQNIQLELFKAFNSQELAFGEEISRDLVIKTVENADGRIKNVTLGNINYSTYAVCWKDGENGLDGNFYETNISTLLRNPFTVTYEVGDEDVVDGGLYFSGIREDLLMSKVGYKYDVIDVHREILYSELILDKPDDWDNAFSLYYEKDEYDNYSPMRADCSEVAKYEPNKYYILKNNTYHKVMYDTAPSDWGIARGTVKYYEKSDSGIFMGVAWQIPEFPTDKEIYRREDIFSVNSIANIPIDSIEEDYGLIGINSFDLLEVTDFHITPDESMQFRDEVYTKSILNGSTQFFIEDEKYDYRLDQKYDSFLTDVDKVETNLTIELGNTDGNTNVYELRQNEGIQIFAPNLIGNTVYSNYVKFQFYSENDKLLSANTDYEIREGEFIAFYWKEDLDSETVYEFYVYGPGCVINPSFDIKYIKGASTVSEEIVRNRQFAVDGNIEFMSPTSNGSRSLNYNESNSVANLIYSDNILSGTKQIVSKRINRISLDTTKYCYWILNELKPAEQGTSSEYYELFAKNGLSSYTLKHDEYFIYTNTAMSEMVILGNGTTISREDTREAWRCVPVSMDKINEEGISALYNYWQKVKSDIDVVENKFISLNSGLKFKMEINQESGVGSFKCDAEMYSYKKYRVLTQEPEDWSDDCTKYFMKNNDGEFENISDPGTTFVPNTYYEQKLETEWNDGMVRFDGEGEEKFKASVNYKSGVYTFVKANDVWVVKFAGEKLIIGDTLERYGITVGGTDEDRYDLYEFYVEYSLDWHAVIESKSNAGKTITFTPDRLSMADFKLYYTSSIAVNSEWIEISGANFVKEGMSMYSQLSLNISPTDEQILLNNQKVKFTTKSGEEIEIVGSDLNTSSDNYNCYENTIRSSIPINILGGDNTFTLREFDSLLNYVYPSIYRYAKIIPKNDDLIYNNNGEVACLFTRNDSGEPQTKSVYFRVPTGEYIIPVEISNLYGADNIECKLDGGNIGIIYEDTPSGILDKVGKFYLYMDVTEQNNANEHVLTVTLNGHNIRNVTIILCNLYKFYYPNNINEFIYIDEEDYKTIDGNIKDHFVSDSKSEYFINKIKNKIKEFDSEHVYNYTYVVPVDHKIDNPLSAQTFFNSSHVFNDYVIAMYEKESYDFGYITVG